MLGLAGGELGGSLAQQWTPLKPRTATVRTHNVGDRRRAKSVADLPGAPWGHRWVLVFGTRQGNTDEYILQVDTGAAAMHAKRMGTAMKIGIGAGAVLTLGFLGWLLTRKKR